MNIRCDFVMCQKHKHSDYSFKQHHKIVKFDLKQTNCENCMICYSSRPDWLWASKIYFKHGSKIKNTLDGDGTKYTKDEDMVNLVMTVMAAVCSKVPLSIVDNDFFKLYECHLDEKQRAALKVTALWKF